MWFLRPNMILRRHGALALLAIVLVMAGAALGQYTRRQQASKGPRAISVIEFDAKGKARLVPIAILDQGRWWDASLYKATPVPMALEPDTVYEATSNGDPVGLFTIEQAESLNGRWFGTGRWREGTEPPKAEVRAPAKEPNPEEERPRLRRPGAQPKTETPAPSPAPKPEASQTPAAKPEPPKSAPAPTPETADRPVLRRGQPVGQEQAEKLPGNVTGPSGKPLPLARPAAPARTLVAVSDARNNDFRPFKFNWKAEEQAKLTKQMTDLAVAELNAFARTHPGPRPAALQDVQVRTFDLDLANEPTLVLTAHAGEAPPEPAAPATTPRRRGPATAKPAPTTAAAPSPQVITNGVEFYVTVVARQDFNGDLHKLLSTVTDSRRLDAYPRLELIDAVDADGNGRGELLFRQINDQGRTFVIYRVGADQVLQLYDGSAPME